MAVQAAVPPVVQVGGACWPLGLAHPCEFRARAALMSLQCVWRRGARLVDAFFGVYKNLQNFKAVSICTSLVDTLFFAHRCVLD